MARAKRVGRPRRRVGCPVAVETAVRFDDMCRRLGLRRGCVLDAAMQLMCALPADARDRVMRGRHGDIAIELATDPGRRADDAGQDPGNDGSATDRLKTDLHRIVDALHGCGQLLTMRDAGTCWLREQAETERRIQDEVSRRLLRFHAADAG